MELRKQSGSVLLSAVLGMLVLGLAGGAYFLFFASPSAQQSTAASEAKAAFKDASAALEKALGDSRNIDLSISRNSAFQCLFSGDGKCQGRGGAFLLFELGNPNHSLTQLAKDAGIDRFGAPCRGFPSADCPLRVEAVWEPVCNGPLCESTKSIRVKGKVSLAAFGDSDPAQNWDKEEMFTPQIQISAAVECERGGGVWAGSDCLTPAQLSERKIASDDRDYPSHAPADTADITQTLPDPQQPIRYECPAEIIVQGTYYPVQMQDVNRGQVVAASIACPQSGLTDLFTFDCTNKPDASYPGEGQWMQVGAEMATCPMGHEQMHDGIGEPADPVRN